MGVNVSCSTSQPKSPDRIAEYEKAPALAEALNFSSTVNIQCPSLEQINTNSGKVNISPRYLFELRLCPRLLYINLVINTSKNGLTDFFQVSKVMASVIWQMALCTAVERDSLIPATATAFTVTHHRHSLLLRLILVHYLPPTVAVVTGGANSPFSLALLAKAPGPAPGPTLPPPV